MQKTRVQGFPFKISAKREVKHEQRSINYSSIVLNEVDLNEYFEELVVCAQLLLKSCAQIKRSKILDFSSTRYFKNSSFLFVDNIPSCYRMHCWMKNHRFARPFIRYIAVFLLLLLQRIITFHHFGYLVSNNVHFRSRFVNKMTELGKRNFKALANEDKPKLTFVTGNKKK